MFGLGKCRDFSQDQCPHCHEQGKHKAVKFEGRVATRKCDCGHTFEIELTQQQADAEAKAAALAQGPW